MTEPDGTAQRKAIQALDELDDPSALRAIRGFVRDHPVPADPANSDHLLALERGAGLLVRWSDPEATDSLVGLLTHPESLVRRRAVEELGRNADPAAAAPLRDRALDPAESGPVRHEAVRSLGALDALHELTEIFRSPEATRSTRTTAEVELRRLEKRLGMR